jgi:hypothetical protein
VIAVRSPCLSSPRVVYFRGMSQTILLETVAAIAGAVLGVVVTLLLWRRSSRFRDEIVRERERLRDEIVRERERLREDMAQESMRLRDEMAREREFRDIRVGISPYGYSTAIRTLDDLERRHNIRLTPGAREMLIIPLSESVFVRYPNTADEQLERAALESLDRLVRTMVEEPSVVRHK